MSGGYACGVKANGHLTVLNSSSDAKRWDPVSPGKIWAGLKNTFRSAVNGVKERAKVVYNIGARCSWGVNCFYSGVLLHDSVGAYSAVKDAFTQKSEFEKKVTAGDTNALIADGITAAAVAATTKSLLPKAAPLHGAANKAPACNSFVPGTLVLLASGESKPIEDVEIGDKVLAADEETGEPTEGRAVTALIRGEGDKTLVTLTLTDGDGDTQQIVATEGHPFWVPEPGEWVDAIDLTAGDWLQTSTGTWAQVTAIDVHQHKAVVHNLTVAVDHTYYVAADERSSALLVHNDNCPITGYSHGDLGEMAELDRLVNDGYTDIASEVTLLAPDGTRFRADFVARDPDGVLKAVEVKTNNGGLTDNQYFGYPQLSTVGSEVRTDKLAGIGYPRGTTIKLDVEVSLWTCPSC